MGIAARVAYVQGTPGRPRAAMIVGGLRMVVCTLGMTNLDVSNRLPANIY